MTLTAENLSKRFNREWIFKNFNYSFTKGIYAITGPNGSGKSTLLQVLWGQLPPTSGNLNYHSAKGEIKTDDIFSHVITATPYMELIEEFTLDELLRFHFSFKKVRDHKSIPEVLELLELSHARNKQIGQFSSGMKQRLKLGLAFYSDAEFVFLDEPTTNLDKKAIEWYWHNFNQTLLNSTVFIGSNLENEVPANAVKISLTDYK